MENDTKTPVTISNQIAAPGYCFKEILTIKEAAAYIVYKKPDAKRPVMRRGGGL
jgi:hypothetical protein